MQNPAPINGSVEGSGAAVMLTICDPVSGEKLLVVETAEGTVRDNPSRDASATRDKVDVAGDGRTAAGGVFVCGL